MPAPSATPGQLYAETRARVSDLLRALPAGQLATQVAACPDWTVKDLAAHLVGAPTDLLEGRFGAASMEDWTAAHVAARKDRTVDELVEEWAAIGPKVEEAMDAEGSRLVVLLADVVTHEQDLRNATGNRGARDAAGIDWTLQFFTGRLGHVLKEKGAPALRIRAGKDEWLLGDGAPATTLEVDDYELARGMVGRRSEAQVRSWSWQGDPEPYLPLLSVFPFRVDDLVE
jgi:uncharacterized protein (TIGR03083 family)